MKEKQHFWKFYDHEIVTDANGKRIKGWTFCRDCHERAPRRKMTYRLGGACTSMALILSIFTLSGCATSPLFQSWDWSIRPDFSKNADHYNEQAKVVEDELEKIYLDQPEWRNTRDSDEILLYFYDENGKKVYFGTAK